MNLLLGKHSRILLADALIQILDDREDFFAIFFTNRFVVEKDQEKLGRAIGEATLMVARQMEKYSRPGEHIEDACKRYIQQRRQELFEDAGAGI